MARQKNDGRGRLGGRAKGTPNKANSNLKAWIQALIDKNREQVERDLEAIDPAERLKIITSLINYVLPKQQAISIDEQISAEYKALEKLLESAPDEAIDKITEKIIKLQSHG